MSKSQVEYYQVEQEELSVLTGHGTATNTDSEEGRGGRNLVEGRSKKDRLQTKIHEKEIQTYHNRNDRE